MGVTIDSLQIEIESSSANAAQGIDALAKALEGLKKNGSFKTVSNNLNNLSGALRNLPNVHSASNALRTLANSIEKLKGVGTVSTLSNSLTKLPAALKSLNNINLDKVKPQLDGIADAVRSLSAIKAGGLSTMVNAIKKLGELNFDAVAKNLSDTSIKNFVERVKQLNTQLGPLSEKMANIKAGFSAINSKARSAASGMKEFGDEVDSSMLNLSSFVSVIEAVVQGIQTLVTKMSEYIHMASQWDGIEYQFGNTFGEQADMYYDKVTEITDALRINKQMFMENAAMAGSMLIGFEVDPKDAREMGLGYTELAYDIWAAYNNVYETLDGADGAMAAVRSAIAGEVEPIRRAGFTIVDSQLAITAANHGLEYSSYSATEAQKSYLRYLTLVDQAMNKGIVGTYASEMQTAEGMMRTFSQQLKSLAQAFGSLFLPILVKVMPYVQAFIELLKEGVYWLANFFGIDIQPVDFSDYKTGAGAIKDVADSAGVATDALDSATESAKALKNATMGIDELNVISPQSNTAGSSGSGGSGGSGSGGGGFEGIDVDSLWDESILSGIKSDVDEIKEKMRGWMPVIASAAAALAGLRLVKLIDDLNVIKNFKAFGKLSKQFGGFATAFVQLAKEGGIIATLAAAFPKMANAVSKIIKFFPAFVGNFGAFIALAKEYGFVQALAAAFPKIATSLTNISSKFGLVGAIITAVITAIAFLIEHWEEMKRVAKAFFDEQIAPKFEEIKKHIDKMKVALEPLAPAFEWLGKAVQWTIDAFGWLMEAIGGIVVALTAGGLAGAFNSIVSVIEGFVQWLSGVVQIVRGVIEVIIGIFTGDGARIVEACKLIFAGVKDVFLGLYDMTIGAVVEFVEGIISWFVKMWDELVGHSIVPDTINAIVEWFTSLPGKVLGAVGTFVANVVDKFKDLGKSLSEKFDAAWEAVKTWWGQKSALTTYTPSIGDIKAKLSAAWTAAKDWWDKTKATLATYTPSIGKIWENLKSAWETAKTWWSKNRGSLSTYTPSIGKIWENLKSAGESANTWWSKNRSSLSYTPSIGSISSKLSSAWTSAKDWWNKKRSSLSYTPSIGSIKDKIVSAWNTAKKWWSSNASLSTKLNISVPKLTVNWGEVSALGKTFKYPKSFSVQFAAKGGIFDQGSLIWAGERGPEVMATAAGGKTGVMNVQQMQDAVYEGVYAAVSAAMRGMGGGDSQEIRVYLDGREISSSVKKHQHESGATIMGNEVYAY